MSLVIADCLTICDYLHEWIEEVQDVCGSEDAWVAAPRPTMEQNTIMEGLFELKAYASDPGTHSMTDANATAMCRHIDREKGRWSYYVLSRMIILEIMRAIDMHLRNYGDGGLNAFLRANDERIGYWFQQAVGNLDSCPIFPVDAVNIFPPGYSITAGTDYGVNHGAWWNDTTTNCLGKYFINFPGNGTYTAGDDIDTTLYGKSNLIAFCSAGASTGAVTFDVTCKKIDETTEVKTVTINNIPLTVQDVGIHGTNMYIGTTLINNPVGGQAGDTFVILSELERFTKIR